MLENGPCQILMVGPWPKSFTWKLELRVVRIPGVFWSHICWFTNPRKNRIHGDSVPDEVQVDTVPQFLDQWRIIASSRFVLNMVRGHHLQLRCHPPLFCNFKWFNIKAATSYPVRQKEVDEILVQGAVEPTTDGAGFYSDVFVVLHVVQI